MRESLARYVWQRAAGRCEYCRMPQEMDLNRFEIDHIRTRKHRGRTDADNLALACSQCNLHKGTDASGFDPRTEKLTPLFHPRRQKWGRHFFWIGPELVGRTAGGRVTVLLLHINDEKRVQLRAELIAEDCFPPD